MNKNLEQKYAFFKISDFQEQEKICLVSRLEQSVNSEKINLELYWKILENIGQGIQEWTEQNLWKIAFKMFEVIWSAYEHHITSNFLKAVRPHHFKSLKRPFLNTLIHIQLL